MRLTIGLIVALMIAACGKQESDALSRQPAALDRPISTESLLQGVRLYQENCAICHGPEAQGHPDWQNPSVTAAPPLNGTGNDWKRRKQEMIAVIKNGAKRNGEPVMPAWKGRLTDREIEDIISWYQALWPPEVYERWRKVNVSATAPKG